MNTKSSRRIDFLDYMRIFAFASVLVGHLFNGHFAAAANNQSLHIVFRQIAQVVYDVCYAGAAGVIVFFLVSGYIITHVVRIEPPVDFIIRRVFRIYPMFIFAVSLQMVMANLIDGAPFPPISDMIPRMLLLGDFFGIEYALGGVEWTLRVEILFYAFMSILKVTGVLRATRMIPWLFLGLTVILAKASPFPSFAGWTNGYFNMFFPFLLSGVVFYMYENNLASRASCVISVLAMLAVSLLQIPSLKPMLSESNFEIVAVGIFFISWRFKDRISGNKITEGMSEMTYAIYLMHLWIWSDLDRLVSSHGIPYVHKYIQMLIILFAVCYVMTRTIEKYGVKAGRVVAKKASVSIARWRSNGTQAT